MKTKTLEFTFVYCCGNKFKKFYTKYIKTLKKQYKKSFKNLEICYNETIELRPIQSSRNYSSLCCNKCYAEKKYDNMTNMIVGKITVKVP